MKSKIQKTKLKNVCKIEKGKIGIMKAVRGEYPLVVTAEERLSHNEWHFNEPATIVPLVSSTGHGHASIKRLHYAEGKYAVGNILATVIPINHNSLNAKYLYVYLTINKNELLVSQMTGAANVTLTLTRLADVEIEIPDYATQLKVIKRYEDFERYKNQMGSQTEAKSQLIENLRQQILQDAITGKLSEKWRRQNLYSESANISLEKVKAENKKTVKKQKPLLPITDNEIHYQLPTDWTWCRLGEITNITRGKSPQYKENGVFKMLNQKCVRWFEIDQAYSKSISINWYNSIPSDNKILPNDLLVNSTGDGTIGRAAIASDDVSGFLFDSHILRVRSVINQGYIAIFINSIYGQKQVNDSKGAKSTKQHELGVNNLSNFLFPLPPLSEQNYIVEHIKLIFRKLDKIKKLNIQNQLSIDQLNKILLKEIFDA